MSGLARGWLIAVVVLAVIVLLVVINPWRWLTHAPWWVWGVIA